MFKGDEEMKCCLCHNEIEIESNGWKDGNSAEPLMKGRCCNYCNRTKVIPYRLKLIIGEKNNAI